MRPVLWTFQGVLTHWTEWSTRARRRFLLEIATRTPHYAAINQIIYSRGRFIIGHAIPGRVGIAYPYPYHQTREPTDETAEEQPTERPSMDEVD